MVSVVSHGDIWNIENRAFGHAFVSCFLTSEQAPISSLIDHNRCSEWKIAVHDTQVLNTSD